MECPQGGNDFPFVPSGGDYTFTQLFLTSDFDRLICWWQLGLTHYLFHKLACGGSGHGQNSKDDFSLFISYCSVNSLLIVNKNK